MLARYYFCLSVWIIWIVVFVSNPVLTIKHLLSYMIVKRSSNLEQPLLETIGVDLGLGLVFRMFRMILIVVNNVVLTEYLLIIDGSYLKGNADFLRN